MNIFSFLIGNRAYKWAFKEGTIKHKMVCAYFLWFVNFRINDTQKTVYFMNAVIITDRCVERTMVFYYATLQFSI